MPQSRDPCCLASKLLQWSCMADAVARGTGRQAGRMEKEQQQLKHNQAPCSCCTVLQTIQGARGLRMCLCIAAFCQIPHPYGPAGRCACSLMQLLSKILHLCKFAKRPLPQQRIFAAAHVKEISKVLRIYCSGHQRKSTGALQQLTTLRHKTWTAP